MQTHILGFPRIGRKRELKKALEGYWKGELSEGQLRNTVDELKNRIGNRYHKVNLEAYSRHKTVEFRQHSGTTNFTKMRNWVLFLHKLVTFATRGQVPTATALRNIPFLDDEQKLYYKLRTKKLSA